MAGDSQRIADEEFERWIPFNAAYQQYYKLVGLVAAREEIAQRLMTGDIVCAARKSVWEHKDGTWEPRKFEILFPTLWVHGGGIPASDSLWATSTRNFSIKERGQPKALATLCTGIRMHPKSLQQLLEDIGEGKLTNPAPPIQNDPPAPKAVAVERTKQLPKPEAERFAKAVMAGWPDATEQWAHAQALLFYPEHKVPRDWFLTIFRAIRGPRSRGKQPKKGD